MRGFLAGGRRNSQATPARLLLPNFHLVPTALASHPQKALEGPFHETERVQSSDLSTLGGGSVANTTYTPFQKNGHTYIVYKAICTVPAKRHRPQS